MFKKLILTGITGFASLLSANMDVVVSILPQKTFVEEIGQDKVNVSLMVKPGNSPHTYEPKPSQMKQISKADLYFSIDVEFEHVWLEKFKSQNKQMKVIDLSKGITKLPLGKHSHEEEHEHKDEHEHEHEHEHEAEHSAYDDHEHEGETLDPHVWTNTSNVKIIVKNIYQTLSKEDPENQEYYKANYEKFMSKINNTDKKIKELLKDLPKDTKFMVFHPAWGYFAKQYGLKQIAIESGGKNPKPRQLAHLIEEAKEEKVTAVFTAPEFSDKAAKQIAKEVGIPVIKVSPLNPQWSKNLIRLAKAIANK
jgi:zinc transport system substrate-binding protein